MFSIAFFGNLLFSSKTTPGLFHHQFRLLPLSFSPVFHQEINKLFKKIVSELKFQIFVRSAEWIVARQIFSYFSLFISSSLYRESPRRMFARYAFFSLSLFCTFSALCFSPILFFFCLSFKIPNLFPFPGTFSSPNYIFLRLPGTFISPSHPLTNSYSSHHTSTGCLSRPSICFSPD